MTVYTEVSNFSYQVREAKQKHINLEKNVENLYSTMLDITSKTDDKIKVIECKSDDVNSKLESIQQEIVHLGRDLEPKNKTSSSTPAVTKFPDTSTSAPTPLVPPSHPSAVYPIDNTIIDLTSILEQTSQVKPVFPSYKQESTSVTKWQSLCMLKLSSCNNSYYNSFIKNENGQNVLDPNLSLEKRASLFSLIHDALPQSKLNLEFITDEMIKNADGLALWHNCAKRFAPTKKGHYEKEELKSEFKSMTKNPTESNSSFLKRIEQKVNELKQYGINLQAHEQALTLLKGLKSESLKTPIVAIMQDDGKGEYKDWILDGDLKHTLEKAESRIKYEKAAAALLRPKTANPYKEATANPYKEAILAGRAPGSSNLTPATPKITSVLTPKQLLIQELKACPDQQKRINKLFQWKAKEKDGCSLHPNLKLHKFLRCEDVNSLCAENGWTKDLVETKLRNQLFAEKKLQEESNASTKGTTSSDTIKAIDKQVSVRKAALEAAQATTR